MSTKLANILKKAIKQTKGINIGSTFRLSALFQPGYLDNHLNTQEREELEIEYFLANQRGEIQDIKFHKEYLYKRSEYKKL